MIFFAFFMILFLLEAILFFAIVQQIGVLATMGLYALSALVGIIMIKYQWVNAMQAGYKAHRTRHLPLGELFDSLCLAIAGFLLLLPGLGSDILAFTLIVPVFRDLWREFLMQRLNIKEMTAAEDDVIDAEFRRVQNENERIETHDR